MELRTLDFSSLYFPKNEWQWLRPEKLFSEGLNHSPDFFVWTANVQGRFWAWDPSGSALAPPASQKTQIRALVLNTDGSELEAHGLYLKTSFSKTPAQDIEWVAALDVLEKRLQYDPSHQGLPKHWAEACIACGLEPHLGVLAQRARYKFLASEERQLCFDKRWDLATLETVETLPAEIRKSLITAVRAWNLSAHNAKEAVHLALVLMKKFGEKTAYNIIAAPHKTSDEFRNGLLTTAQPELAALSQKRIEQLRSLHVPPRTSIFSDPSFEKDILKLTHNPRHIGDFEAFKSWVNDPDTTDKMKQLFEIYQ